MNLFTRGLRGALAFTAGTGAGAIARAAIDNVAPAPEYLNKWGRFAYKFGRYALVSAAIDLGTRQVKKDFDEVFDAIEKTKEAVDELKTDATFREIAEQFNTKKDEDDKKD